MPPYRDIFLGKFLFGCYDYKSMRTGLRFVLLIIIGGNMFKEAMGEAREKVECCIGCQRDVHFGDSHLALMHIAAWCNTFAFLKVQDSSKLVSSLLWLCELIVCSAIGVKIGSIFGSKYRSKIRILRRHDSYFDWTEDFT